MPRPQKVRKILCPPAMSGFSPYGIPATDSEPIIMTFEEFESIKLVNYEKMPQEEAALLMQISRPTFTRIYNRALNIIGIAFVEARSIQIEGGNCEFEREWFRCTRCFKLIEGLENHSKCTDCPNFEKNELTKLNPNIKDRTA